MPATDEDGLTPGERSTLGAVLGRDPALEAELMLILSALGVASRASFLRQLAATAPETERPAAAVLAALVGAARDGGS